MSVERHKIISVESLTNFVIETLCSVDVPRGDAEIVADCLLTANLSGIDSHGVVRLSHYVQRLINGSIKPQPEIQFKRTGPSVGYLDGGHGLGHVVTNQATTKAMELARYTGVGIISVGNSSHFGMAGYYALRLAKKGYIGICMTPTDRLLVPFGASEPFFGSNPICFSFPTDGIPVVLDMATTSIPYGKLALAAIEGKNIPDDWALDEEGNPTTDPNTAVGLLPASGPKGSGLAMIVDIFGSVLSGMPWGPHITQMYKELDSPRRLGHFIIAINVKYFMPVEEFKRKLGEMLEGLNALTPSKGFKKVYYPGQIEGEMRKRRAVDGIPLESGLYDQLLDLSRTRHVDFD